MTQALIHRSYINEHPGLESNERLEFLGDSVLSLIISEKLFKLFPLEPEGKLTARRAYLVQTTTLAVKSVQLGLDKQIKLSKGEEDGGGRQNPSLLADTFEAVLGELFLDQGLAACIEFVDQAFPHQELIDSDLHSKDAKSLLQEKAQSAKFGTPSYEVVSAVGPDHAKTFTIAVIINGKTVCTGEGNSKQRAEQAAATLALAQMFP